MTNLNITIQSPELITAIRQLTEALTGTKTPAAAVGSTPTPTPEPVVEAAPAPAPTATFDEVHAALVALKRSKGAAAVRGVLEVLGCTSVQDIPEERYGDALLMAANTQAAGTK